MQSGAIDGVGNPQARTLDQDGERTEETYAYEAGSHRIDGVTTTDDEGTEIPQFQHNDNGNIVNDISIERELEMIVNARNSLEAITNDGEQVGEYEYNALGQRVAKTSRYRGRLHAHFDQGKRADKSGGGQGPGKAQGKKNGKGAAPNSKPTRDGNLHSHDDNKPVTERLHFHYDQVGNLIAESDNRGNIVREYIYLGNYRIAMTATGLDKPGVSPDVISTGAAAGRGVEKSRSLTLYYIHNDHLGTPRKVTDAEQRIVWSMEQTPFGEVSLMTEAIRMPMRFPGQYADIESGFSYNYFRDYDPSLGRYIQSDPIGLKGGSSTYRYVFQNPMLSSDPTGAVVPLLVNAIGAGVGAIVGAISAGSSAQLSGASPDQVLVAAALGAVGGALAGALGPSSLMGALFTGTATGGIADITVQSAFEDSIDPARVVTQSIKAGLSSLTGNVTAFRAALTLIRGGSTLTSSLAFGESLGTTISGFLSTLISRVEFSFECRD